MVVNETIASLDLTEPIISLIRLLQILGGLLGLVVIYWVVATFINIRKTNVLKKILENLEEINKKLDKLK